MPITVHKRLSFGVPLRLQCWKADNKGRILPVSISRLDVELAICAKDNVLVKDAITWTFHAKCRNYVIPSFYKSNKNFPSVTSPDKTDSDALIFKAFIVLSGFVVALR